MPLPEIYEKTNNIMLDAEYIMASANNAINICINRFNKRNGENLSSDSDVSGALPYIDFEIELESKEICEIIINKILMMPESYKCALYLHYAHGHTAKEIAKITGENENTVKSRLRRGTLLLKKILSDEGIAE